MFILSRIIQLFFFSIFRLGFSLVVVMIKYISKENNCVILLSINSLIFLYHFFKISDTFFFPGDFLRSNLQHSMSGFKMEQQYYYYYLLPGSIVYIY